MSLVDNLNLVRNRIEHGWTQWSYYIGATECYCLAGAVWTVLSDIDDVFKALSAELPSDYPFSPYSRTPEGRLITWNDDPKRTKEEVLALVDRAIERVKR